MLLIENLAHAQALAQNEAAASPSLADLERFLIKNVGEDLNLDDMSQPLGISKFALTRLFHKRYGIAPMRWLWSFRAHLARDVIALQLGLPLMDVLTLCGFNSPQHFSRFFRKTFRQAPSKLMKELGSDVQTIARDVPKARQELYERFESIVSASLQQYMASYQLPTAAAAAEPAAELSMETAGV